MKHAHSASIDKERINLIEFEPYRLVELVHMWRTSFEAGVGITDPHPIADQQQYFVDEVLPRNEVRVVLLDDRLVGFVAATKESVAQLYVRVGFHRRGIGTRLLSWAKDQSAGSLWLYT
ncbi:MAG: GNAT family N-acetyltransferase, partial [Burkholderiaceae bacterium]